MYPDRRNPPQICRRARKWPQKRQYAAVAGGFSRAHLSIMQRNRLGRSVAATLVLLLAGCGSSGDEQVADAPVTTIVTAESAAVPDTHSAEPNANMTSGISAVRATE